MNRKYGLKNYPNMDTNRKCGLRDREEKYQNMGMIKKYGLMGREENYPNMDTIRECELKGREGNYTDMDTNRKNAPVVVYTRRLEMLCSREGASLGSLSFTAEVIGVCIGGECGPQMCTEDSWKPWFSLVLSLSHDLDLLMSWGSPEG